MSEEDGEFLPSSWDVPVYVRIGCRVTETIRGPEEALDLFLNRWPTERGKYHGVAKLACAGALVNSGCLEGAGEAFNAAAIEVTT
jgi:hypothetical protein